MSTPVDKEVRQAVFAVLDGMFACLNAGDTTGVESFLHFPHYRLAAGRMIVIERAGIPAQKMVKLGTEWHHTVWDRRDITAWSQDKVHVDTQFTRCREDGSAIETFDSLYVLTRESGRWGIKLRSSFAP